MTSLLRPVQRRTRTTLLAAVTLAATAALAGTAAAATSAVPTLRAAPAKHAVRVTAADTGASDVTDLGGGGWSVQSSAVATQSGATISTPGFSTSSWLPVSNDDAGAPGTEVQALAANGMCPGDPG